MLSCMNWLLAWPVLLLLFFKNCLDSGKCPVAWEKAVRKPFHKGRLRSNFSNYWPISSTSIFSRIMEKVIVDQVQNYFEKKIIHGIAKHGLEL